MNKKIVLSIATGILLVGGVMVGNTIKENKANEIFKVELDKTLKDTSEMDVTYKEANCSTTMLINTVCSISDIVIKDKYDNSKELTIGQVNIKNIEAAKNLVEGDGTGTLDIELIKVNPTKMDKKSADMYSSIKNYISDEKKEELKGILTDTFDTRVYVNVNKKDDFKNEMKLEVNSDLFKMNTSSNFSSEKSFFTEEGANAVDNKVVIDNISFDIKAKTSISELLRDVKNNMEGTKSTKEEFVESMSKELEKQKAQYAMMVGEVNLLNQINQKGLKIIKGEDTVNVSIKNKSKKTVDELTKIVMSTVMGGGDINKVFTDTISINIK